MKKIILSIVLLFSLIYLSYLVKKTKQTENYMSSYQPPKYFYCIKNDKCLKYPQQNFPLQQNICPGFNIRGEYNPLIFYSEEDCNKFKNTCFNFTTKNSCSAKKWCGWCTDKEGKGKCVLGTPTGPMDMVTNLCYPDAPNGKNAFYYGHLATFFPNKINDPNYVQPYHNEEDVFRTKL